MSNLRPFRPFHLGVVLTITTGRLVAPGGMSAVHELLDYMTGDALFTHQLPRGVGECAPALLAQHPDLAAVQPPEEFPEPAEESVPAWLAEQVDRYGEYRHVAPLAAGDHTRINPLDELAMNHPHTRVIPVVIGPEADTHAESPGGGR